MDSLFGPGLDQATADLIVQLQLEDVGLHTRNSKGKSRDPTDEQLAFQLQNNDLESMSQLLSDRKMAMNLANSQVEEENIAKDRDIARHWTENGGHPTAANGPLSNPESTTLDDDTLDDDTLSKLQLLYVSGIGDYPSVDSDDESSTEGEQAESSAWAARRPRQTLSRMHRCIACGEDAEFVNVVRAPCRHEYCRTCLEDLFKASLTDESLFPPRCCKQPIVLSIARIFLKSELVQQYEKKKREYETPNRTYCYSAGCSAFIDMSNIEGEVATCSECGRTTCTSCKGRAHMGDCPNDTSMQLLLDAARENGWQRCYSCWRMVELDHGCNHMTFLSLSNRVEIAAAVVLNFATTVGCSGKLVHANNGMSIVSLRVHMR
ncbi:IBR finger domain-containing protein [Penicillium sp. DV-2018c]|nr:IBR finger domain-containing protein [Penicillium sp. DV-2018c]